MPSIRYRRSRSVLDGLRALPVVEGLSDSYPGFVDWYVSKALPDAVVGEGVLILAEQRDEIVGLALGKLKDGETKLRCVRVVDRLRNRGIGIHLLDRALAALDCDRPLASVPQDMMHDFSRIMSNRFGFCLTSVEKGLYKPGRLEYVFNGAGADIRTASPY